MASKFLVQVKESTTRKEIRTISKILEIDTSEEEFIKRAEEIAFYFLNINELINPITLARSSCYLALKQHSKNPETQIHLIRNNNGHENKWFVYLAPIMEKEIETMK